jgi:ABC-type transport system involved in multi-copper enzyme maturation permease subunit
MSAAVPIPTGKEPRRPRALLGACTPGEWCVGLVLLGWAVAVLLAHEFLPGWLHFALWAGWVVVLLALLRRGWSWLFGPVFAFEMVRTFRRPWHLLYRCLYAAALLLILSWVYWNWQTELTPQTAPGFDPATEMPRFARQFLNACLVTQFLATLLLTPLCTAGAIADEKERRTLDFLLATDLTNREIVLGKLAARLANLGLVLLTPLPILALTELWGGIDPQTVLTGFILTAVTMLLLGSISMFTSVVLPRTLHAIPAAYAPLSAVAFLIFALAVLLGQGQPAGVAPGRSLLIPLLEVVFALPFLILAVALLRSEARGVPAVRGTQPPFARAERVTQDPPRRRPPVTDHPLLWKELSGSVFRWDGPKSLAELLRLCVILFVIWFTSGAILLNVVMMSLGSGKGYPFALLTSWARTASVLLVGLLCFLTALSAAGRVSREREQQTLDSLLTIPEESSSILFAKWLGAILSVRQAWWCLAAVWGWGLVTAGLHLLALPLVVLAWAVYTAFAASLGLFFSVICRTTLRATLATGLTLLVLVVGLGILGNNSRALLTSWGLREGWAVILRDGLAPPMPLWVVAFGYGYNTETGTGPGQAGLGPSMLAAVLGLGVYAAAARLLWSAARARFDTQTGRAPVRGHRRPEPAA